VVNSPSVPRRKPRLKEHATMENASVKSKRRRYSAEEVRERKKAVDRASDSTRINIGRAFTEWRELRDIEYCKTDADLAFLLMQVYCKYAFVLGLFILVSHNKCVQPTTVWPGVTGLRSNAFVLCNVTLSIVCIGLLITQNCVSAK